MTDQPTRSKSAWLDETSSVPIISEKAQQMESFLAAMADGKVNAAEVAAQEAKLTAVMKEVEPLLNDASRNSMTTSSPVAVRPLY